MIKDEPRWKGIEMSLFFPLYSKVQVNYWTQDASPAGDWRVTQADSSLRPPRWGLFLWLVTDGSNRCWLSRSVQLHVWATDSEEKHMVVLSLDTHCQYLSRHCKNSTKVVHIYRRTHVLYICRYVKWLHWRKSNPQTLLFFWMCPRQRRWKRRLALNDFAFTGK